MRVVPQRRHRVTVTETGLGLEQLPVANEMGGHGVTETVKRRPFDPGGDTEAAELVRQGVGGEERRPGWRGCEQPVVVRRRSPLRPRRQCDSISATVVAPRVSRRDRFDLVEPITPCDTPRWIVSTRPSMSP